MQVTALDRALSFLPRRTPKATENCKFTTWMLDRVTGPC
jgi:hypothetical protein